MAELAVDLACLTLKSMHTLLVNCPKALSLQAPILFLQPHISEHSSGPLCLNINRTSDSLCLNVIPPPLLQPPPPLGLSSVVSLVNDLTGHDKECKARVGFSLVPPVNPHSQLIAAESFDAI